MKKIRIIFLFILIIQNGFSIGTESACSILQKTFQKIHETENILLKFKYYRKNFYEIDTAKKEGFFYVCNKGNKDGEYFKSFLLDFDIGKSYLKMDTMVYQYIKDKRTYQILPLKSGISDRNCFDPYINFGDLMEYCKDTSYHIKLSETISLDKHACYEIEIRRKDKNYSELYTTLVLLIDKNNYSFFSVSHKVDFNKESQYELAIFNNEISKIEKANYSHAFFIKKKLQIEKEYKNFEYDKNVKKQEKPLDSLSIAPNFILLSTEDSTMELNKIANKKIIIIDFGYISCYPCQKTIPVLCELNNIYKNKDVFILSIDPYDSKEKTKAHIEKHNIDIPVLLSTKEVSSLYHVNAYPTILVLNSNKQIIKTIEGYYDNLKSDLELIIEKEISK